MRTPSTTKEILPSSHLRTLSEQSATPSSPTGSSLSSLATAPPPSGQVTPQQILIAHLLLALLSNPPSYSVPLNQLKELLASRVSVRGQAITRPIYGCIAKKLLKIDRGGGEQVVRFDVYYAEAYHEENLPLNILELGFKRGSRVDVETADMCRLVSRGAGLSCHKLGWGKYETSTARRLEP